MPKNIAGYIDQVILVVEYAGLDKPLMTPAQFSIRGMAEHVRADQSSTPFCLDNNSLIKLPDPRKTTGE